MRKLQLGLFAAVTALLAGCGGGGAAEAAEAAKVVSSSGPGYIFTILLVVIPIFVILVKLFRESEATSDSLISLEGQLRRLNNKIDDLEAGLKGEKKSE